MSAVLLQRESELAEIGRQLDAARRGHGSVAAIVGPPGSGKSSLIAAASERAEADGLTVLRARASEMERSFAFGVARQLFEPVLARRDGGSAASVLGGQAGEAALVGLHELLLELAAEQPIALLIDDFQWTDRVSREWLGFTARRLDSTAVGVLVAIRSGDAASFAQTLLDPAAHIIRPSALAEAAATELLEQRLGMRIDAAFARACVEATGGNPFLLHELARALAVQHVPPDQAHARGVAAVITERLELFVSARMASVPDDAAALARAIALLGAEIELREAASLAGMPLACAAAAGDVLRRAGVLAPGERLSFVHPLVAHGVCAAIPAGARALAHARAARVCAERGPEAVAAHLLQSEPCGERWAVEQLMAAADAALLRGAPGEAVALLRRAEREQAPGCRVAVLAALGGAETRIGDDAAAEHLRAALASAADLRERGTIALALARALIARGDADQALEILDAHVTMLREPLPELAFRLEAELCANGRFAHGWAGRTAERISRISPDLIGATAGQRALLACLAAELAAQGRDARLAAGLAERALADGRLLADTAGEAPAYRLACAALVWADRHAAAQRHLQALRTDGSALALATAATWRAESLLRSGDVRGAEAEALEALRLCAANPGLACEPLALAWSMLALLAQGRDEAAATALADSDWSAQLVERPDFAPLLYARGELRRARRDFAGALVDFDAAGRLLSRFAIGGATVVPWRSASAGMLAGLGQQDAARARAEDDVDRARAYGAPATLGRGLRTLALVGAADRRIAVLREAVTALAASEARLDYAQALADLGAALRRTGSRRDSRGPLRHALELATECGASVLVASVREELRASGARPRRVQLSGRDALTPAELRVAQLATDGLTNREIAQALFVTVKTVETQLGQSYLKLGIGSRRELAAALDPECVKASGSFPDAA